jgi:Holliday junction resolvase RusA-like endonuclease
MNELTIIIDGPPIALERSRSTRKGFHYDPQAKVKQSIVESVKGQLEGFEKNSEPVGMQMTFLFKMPKAWSKKKREKNINSYHTGPKDIDNICKFFLDTFNGVLYEDDKQVCLLQAAKAWAETDKTIIKFSRMTKIEA